MLYTSKTRYRGIGRVDITTKGASDESMCFAPTQKMSMDLQKGLIMRKEFASEYYGLLNYRIAHNEMSIKENTVRLIQKAQVRDITLVCVCNNTRRCHRVLLAHWLETMSFNTVTYCGERKL